MVPLLGFGELGGNTLLMLMLQGTLEQAQNKDQRVLANGFAVVLRRRRQGARYLSLACRLVLSRGGGLCLPKSIG